MLRVHRWFHLCVLIKNGSAVETMDKLHVFHFLQITADGCLRKVKLSGEVFNENLAGLRTPDMGDN